MGTGKRQLVQLSRRTPASLWNCPGQSVRELSAENRQRDPVTRDRVPDLLERFDGGRARAQQISRQLSQFARPPADFDVGKFPKPGVDHTGRALADQKVAVPGHNEGGKMAGCRGDSFSQIRQPVRPPLAKGDAVSAHRANTTLRLARKADNCAQFHQRLIQVRAIPLCP